MPSLLDSIFGKQKLEDVSLDEIYSVIAEFPSFNAAHFLLSKKLKAANDPAFPEETKKTALYFNNPVWLQFLLDEEPDEEVENRGPSLVENLRTFSGTPGDEDEMTVFTSFEQKETISIGEEIKEPVQEDRRPEQEEYEEYREPEPETEEQASAFDPSEPDFQEPVQDSREPEPPQEYGETLQEGTEPESPPEYGEALQEETEPEPEFPEAVRDFREPEPQQEYSEPAEEHQASQPVFPESVEEQLSEPEAENSGVVMEYQEEVVEYREPEPESGLTGMENRLSDNDSFDPPVFDRSGDDLQSSIINEEAFQEPDQEQAHPATTVNEEYAEAMRDLPVVNQEFEEEPHPAITVNEEYARKEAEIPTINEEFAAPSGYPPFDAKKAESIVFEPYHMIDYFASQGIRLVMEDHPTDSFGKQLKSFTDWLKVMKRLPQKQLIPEKTDEWETDRIRRFAANSIEERDILTETMAEVLAKQGMYENAIALYQKLSLIYPPKSAYFASRIEQLKASLS
jgi:hypothetical protein